MPCQFLKVVVIIGTIRPVIAQLCTHPRVRSAPSNGGHCRKVGGTKCIHAPTFNLLLARLLLEHQLDTVSIIVLIVLCFLVSIDTSFD